MIERYKERTGCYPERILADKIYRNRENLSYCAERKIRLSGPAHGRPKKDEICDKKQDYIDESERVEVERKFSLAKRKCGIGLIVTRLKETTCHCLAMSVLLLNLRKIGKVLFTIFLLWFQKLLKIYNDSKMAIVRQSLNKGLPYRPSFHTLRYLLNYQVFVQLTQRLSGNFPVLLSEVNDH